VQRLAAAMEVSQGQWHVLHDELSADEKHSHRALQLLDGILNSVQLGETSVR
jgi:hypothetical protein